MISILKNSLLVIMVMLTSVIALTGSVQAAGNCDKGTGALDLPTWYKYVPLDGSCSIDKENAAIKGHEGRLIILILLGVFDIVLYIAGFAAVVFLIYGGFKFLTSTGEPQKIAAARQTIFNALIGVAIALIASRIVAFVGGQFF